MMSLNQKIHNLQKTELNILSSNIVLEENLESFIATLKDVEIDNFLSHLAKYSDLFSPFFETKDINDSLKITLKNNVNNVEIFDSIEQMTAYKYRDDYEGEVSIIEVKILKG